VRGAGGATPTGACVVAAVKGEGATVRTREAAGKTKGSDAARWATCGGGGGSREAWPPEEDDDQSLRATDVRGDAAGGRAVSDGRRRGVGGGPHGPMPPARPPLVSREGGEEEPARATRSPQGVTGEEVDHHRTDAVGASAVGGGALTAARPAAAAAHASVSRSGGTAGGGSPPLAWLAPSANRGRPPPLAAAAAAAGRPRASWSNAASSVSRPDGMVPAAAGETATAEMVIGGRDARRRRASEGGGGGRDREDDGRRGCVRVGPCGRCGGCPLLCHSDDHAARAGGKSGHGFIGGRG